MVQDPLISDPRRTVAQFETESILIAIRPQPQILQLAPLVCDPQLLLRRLEWQLLSECLYHPKSSTSEEVRIANHSHSCESKGGKASMHIVVCHAASLPSRPGTCIPLSGLQQSG